MSARTAANAYVWVSNGIKADPDHLMHGRTAFDALPSQEVLIAVCGESIQVRTIRPACVQDGRQRCPACVGLWGELVAPRPSKLRSYS